MIPQSFIEHFLNARLGQEGPFKTAWQGEECVYVGRGPDLLKLTRKKDCPFKVINTALVNKLFRKPLFNLEGEEHSRRRTLWKSGLTNSRLEQLSQSILYECERHTATWLTRVNLKDKIPHLMTDICATAILGLASRLEKTIFRQAYEIFQTTLNDSQDTRSIMGRLRLLRGVAAVSTLRAMMTYQAWRLRRTGTRLPSLLGMVEEAGHSESRRAINDDLLAIIVAARDTTSSALIWMMLELANNPSIQPALRAECESLSSPGSKLSMQTIRNLVRCQSFVLEVLRLHSPNVLAMKVACSQTTLGTLNVEPGTRCAYSPLFEHFDSQLFPFPFTFDSERFLDFLKARALLTFGTGAHSCIGRHLAQMTMVAVLCTVLKRFEIQEPSVGWSEYTYSSLGKLPKSNVSVCLKQV